MTVQDQLDAKEREEQKIALKIIERNLMLLAKINRCRETKSEEQFFFHLNRGHESVGTVCVYGHRFGDDWTINKSSRTKDLPFPMAVLLTGIALLWLSENNVLLQNGMLLSIEQPRGQKDLMEFAKLLDEQEVGLESILPILEGEVEAWGERLNLTIRFKGGSHEFNLIQGLQKLLQEVRASYEG